MQTQEVCEITEIHFGVSSPEAIFNQSTVEVKVPKLSINFDKQKRDNTVYDPKMGVIENSLCVVCKNKQTHCNGHFGHIHLAHPVINPLFTKSALMYLRVLCFGCHTFLHTSIVNPKRKSFRNEYCPHCNEYKCKVSVSDHVFYIHPRNEPKRVLPTTAIAQHFAEIPPSEYERAGIDAQLHGPRNFIFTHYPVVPTKVRPYVTSTLMTCDDDLTVKYVEIVKSNLKIMKGLESGQNIAKDVGSLEFHIRTFIDNTQSKAKYINGRPMKSMKERISGKHGQLRNHMMGKRVNFSARTVIGPDPTMDCYTLAVPHEICNILTKPVHVNQRNLTMVQKWVDEQRVNTITKPNGTRINVQYSKWEKRGTPLFNGDTIQRGGARFKYTDGFVLQEGDHVWRRGAKLEKLELPVRKPVTVQIGDIVDRYLMDGDTVLLNRQPTLHKGSMMSFRIKRIQGKSIRMNLAVTKSFNADFDGDEMNIHVAQNVLADVELQQLSSVQANFIRPQTNKCNVAIVQDSLLGIFLMSKTTTAMDVHTFRQLAYAVPHVSYTERMATMETIYRAANKLSLLHSPRALLSLVLPDTLSYTSNQSAIAEEPTLRICMGTILEGALNKSALWSSHGSILQQLYLHVGQAEAMRVTHDIQVIANHWLMVRGFSLGISDCVPSCAKQIRNHIDSSLIDIDTRQQNTKMSESSINVFLNNAKDTGNKLAKDTITDDNAFLHTISSGSKGDWVNITQISGLLGQQNVSGTRFAYTSYDGTQSLSCFPKQFPDDLDGIKMKYKSRGFVQHSFYDGLDPVEFFYHASSGREGITDTACKTADSGYIQRRMIKMMEDVSTRQDGTTRHSSGRIIQFIYGSDGFDPSKLVYKNKQAFFVDVAFLAQMYNVEYAREFTMQKSSK